MDQIEWKETEEHIPAEGSLFSFCQENHIKFGEIDNSDGPVTFIAKQAVEGLLEFLANDKTREHGGVLIGQPYWDSHLRLFFVVITAAIPAYQTEGSPVHLQFTPDSWDFISGLIDENFPDQIVIGWYHSHPRLGVFMSSTDQATQKAFFNHPWNLAVVVDPIAQKAGWFAGENCTPMTGKHVILFAHAHPKEAIPEQLELFPVPMKPGYPRGYIFDNLLWLLPAGFLMTFVYLWMRSWHKSRD
jgi:proteasome lid subunit RPN8/RPN11